MDLLINIEQSGLAAWVRESPSLFAYPAILFLHTVGLGFMVGTNAIVDLRILGVARQIELKPLQKLYPVMWAGFWISAVSGVLLWAADATTMSRSPLFLAKIGTIALATICVARLRHRVFRSDAPEALTTSPKVLASLSLILWLAAITAGRLTAYLK